MDLTQGKDQYLGKMMRHKTKPYVLFAAGIYEFEGEIKISFQYPHYRHIPKGNPVMTTLNDGL